MTTKELLNTTSHRPYPIPESSWLFYQEWKEAIFLHWPVPLEVIRPFVHPNIEIDTINNQAWISLVAFTMDKVSPKFLPSFPPVSTFHEVNIRTYVVQDGKQGVYFLSLEAEKFLATQLAKHISGLPYRQSKIERGDTYYQSENVQENEQLNIQFTIGDAVNQKTELDKWLTERYSLTQDSNEQIVYYDIHHEEWPLQSIQVNQLKIDYPRFNQLMQGPPALIHYSPGVHVLAWDKQIV